MFDKQSEKRFPKRVANKNDSALAVKLEIWLSQELQRLETEYGHFVTARSNRNFFKKHR